MGLNDLQYDEGQTPLDPDEKDGLLIPTIVTRADLNEWEQRNIEDAIRWTIERRKRFTVEGILSEQFVNELHRKMFGEVWQWAGNFKKTNKNIGVDKHQIGADLRILLGDCRYWVDNKTFPGDEIAVRFKHRLVSIHCYASGNGRHSRLMADVIIEKIFGKAVFTWGSQNLIQSGTERSSYLKALTQADNGKIEPLVAFARS